MAQDKRDEKMERSKYIYEQVNTWIENADNKVSVSCGIFTGVFGVITFLSERLSAQGTVNECWRTVYHWCFGISLVLMLASILFYVLAINPNLGKSGKKKNGTIPKKKCPIFYGDIAELSLADYKKTMNQATEEDFINELQAEVHFNSGICTEKMKKYRIGLWLSFAAIIFALGSWAARYLMMH
jgi:dipeptide/tripeptide permease